MNIYEKISNVMKNVEYLSKDDKVEFGNTKYKAISEEKVTREVRKELNNQGIVIIPINMEIENKELIRTEKSVNMLTTVHAKYRIQNIEDISDYIEAESVGTGVDTQDKGSGKAMTYAYKYLLLRTFAIPTGEDPDKISSAEEDAKIQNELENSAISKTQESALDNSIENHKIQDETVSQILQKYGYNSTTEIKNKDFMKIVNEFQKIVGGK